MSWKHQKWSSFVQRFGLLEKTSPERLSSAPLERPHQLLLTNPCAAKLQGQDSWIYVFHLKKVSNAEWIKHHSNWWPESKDFQEVKQVTTEGNKNTRPGLYTVLSLLPLTLFSVSFLELQHSYQYFPIYYKRRKHFWLLDLLSETLICPWCRRSLGLTAANFFLIPNAIANYISKPMGVTCLVPIPCLNLSPTILVQVNTSTVANCITFVPLKFFSLSKYNLFPCTQGKYKWANSSL